MQAALRCAVTAALVLGLPAQDAEAQQRRVRVAVLDLDNTTNVFSGQNDFAKQASDQLVTALVQLNTFDVMERSELENLMSEQDISNMGGNDLAIAIGELGTVDYLITGTISKLAFTEHGFGPVKYTEIESEVNLRVINTATGQVEGAVVGAGKKRGASLESNSDTLKYSAGVAEDALGPGINDAAAKIAALPLHVVAGAETPTIVGGGDDGSIYISQGENYGVRVGQRFQILRVVDEIVVNGEVVDRITKKVGVLEVTRVLSRSAIGTVVEGEGSMDDQLLPIDSK